MFRRRHAVRSFRYVCTAARFAALSVARVGSIWVADSAIVEHAAHAVSATLRSIRAFALFTSGDDTVPTDVGHQHWDVARRVGVDLVPFGSIKKRDIVCTST